MVYIYLIGHCFEYEVRNIYRIFDLNSKIVIKMDEEIDNCNDIIIESLLEESNGLSISVARIYYKGKLIRENKVISSEFVLEKNDILKKRKVTVKKALYGCMSEYYNKKSKYGILTGIRPGKILSFCYENGIVTQKKDKILKETYEISSEKIKLLENIYQVQKKYIVKSNVQNNYNLYIHIPFCPSRCSYCSFTTTDRYDKNTLDKYVDVLCIEILKTINLAKSKKLNLNTIYIGGGTPSVLSIENIDKIFSTIRSEYDLKTITEISFEAGRPDTLDRDKLECLKNNGVGRISINPQSMCEETLKNISREHSVKDVIEKYRMAREIGFDSINMDLIIGLPGENIEHVSKSINEVIKLRPDNITVHALAYKKGSKLVNSMEYFDKDESNMEILYDAIKKECLKNEYIPYYMYRQKNIKGNLDNVGYTLKNKESVYNIVIIEEIETILACGAGATSKIIIDKGRHERVENSRDILSYVSNIEKNMSKKFFFMI